jgi:eukaryotic-like serine/threonine-protein kinase
MKHFLLVLCGAILYTVGGNAADWTNSRGGQTLHGVTSSVIPTTVKLKWTYPIGSELKSSPVIQGSNIVIGSTDGTVYCLTLAGKIRWKFKTDNAIEAPALILNNCVYVGNLSGNFYAINLTTGRQIWKYFIDYQIMAGANWWNDGKETYLLIGSYDYCLHCLHLSTGRLKWKYEAKNYLNATAAIEKDRVVFGGCDGLLHVVNLRTGKAVSATEISTYVASSVALENGFAYVGDYEGKVSCFDYAKKSFKWKFDNPNKDIPFVAAPCVLGNRVMIGCRDRYFYCLNKTTGKPLWKKNMGNPVDASAVADRSNVLVCSMRGELFLLNQQNGAKIWSYEIGSPIIGNPAVGSDFLVVGAQNGNVYCLTKK